MKVRFQVRNAGEIEPARALHAVFSQRGGFIGSSSDATWCIQDLNGTIPEHAARILERDGHFTIEAISGAAIRINGAGSAIPENREVILSDKDLMRIGGLDISVALGDHIEDGTVTRQSSLDQMVGGEDGDAETSIVTGSYKGTGRTDDVIDAVAADPLEIMNRTARRGRSVDPLDVLGEKKQLDEASGKKALPDPLMATQDASSVVQTADESDMHYASMPVQAIRKDAYGFDQIEGVAARMTPSTDPLNEVDHVALRPLARKLGLQFGDLSPSDAERAMSDIGGSLRAVLAGLNRIYRDLGTKSGNFPLATMHLHALEDNPIRFSTDVDAVLHAFFSKRGPVHLSAPSAIEESLDHLYEHQGATEAAIDEALDSVLAALAPRALERRFEAYDPDFSPVDDEAREAWCWRMYKAYYAEMRSERQRGLQMLFWEVFGQEYQTAMRRAEMKRNLGEEGEY